MSSKRRHFTSAFKLQVLSELSSGKPIAELTREYQLSKNAIYKWQDLHNRYKEMAFAGQGNAYTVEARMNQMEQLIGQLTVENQLLKKLWRYQQDASVPEQPQKETLDQ